MEKYIIAVDMDGTLLNSENKISERNRNESSGVLQRLIDDGHYVVPATGRTRELIPQEFSVLRGVKWGIVENGCVVWDYDKNEMIWRKTMPKGMVSKILKDVEDSGAKGWIAEAYANGIAYSDADARDYVASVADKDLLEKTFVDYFLSRHKYVKDFYHQEDILDQAEKINIYFDDMENSRELREKWKDLDDVAVTTSISGNAEFNAAGVDKGVGLAMLRTKLGIDRMHVIAFGDNENDLEMLEGAGIGVAMGNAKDEVKAKADFVCKSVEEDGIYHYCIENKLIF